MGVAWQKEKNTQTNIFLENFSLRRPQHCAKHGEDENGKPLFIELNEEEEKERMKTIVVPDGDFLIYWLAVVSVAVVYNLWVLIAREAWPELQEKSRVAWFVADYFCDFIYILDIVVQARTAYLEQGLLVIDKQKLLRHYVKSWQFIVDILSLLPTDLFYLLDTNRLHPIVRCPRFLRVYRFQFWNMKVESRIHFPNFFRVFHHIHVLLLGIHWTGAAYFLISKAISGDTSQSSDWVYSGPDGRNATLPHKYLASFYWSTLTLTTIGDLPAPDNEIEYAVQIVGYLVGIFIFATVVGQVSAVIVNRNATRLEFERQVDHAKQYMRRNNVPRVLQLRVLRWYDYTWTRGATHGQFDINSLGLLPDTHRTELALHVNLQLLEKVSIFEVCPPEVLNDLVLKMKFCICTPGDMICKNGALAREMFFISDGLFKVTDDSGRVVATRASGEFFGEIGILNLKENSHRRTANVQSVGFSEVFILSKDDIVEVLKHYPTVMNLIQEEGMRRLETLTTKKPSTSEAEDDVGNAHDEADVDEDVDRVSRGPGISSESSPGTTNQPSNESQHVRHIMVKQHRDNMANNHGNGPALHAKDRSSSNSGSPKVTMNDILSSMKKAVSEKIDSFAEDARLMEGVTNTMRERVRTLQREMETKEEYIQALEKRIQGFQASVTDARLTDEPTHLQERLRALERQNQTKDANISEMKTRIKELEELVMAR